MTKKFEKITLITCIDAYNSKHDAGITALDELIPIIERYAENLTLIDYDLEGEYELVKQPDGKVRPATGEVRA